MLNLSDIIFLRTAPHKYLASAMPKSVMPSADKNGKVSTEKKRKNHGSVS